MTNREILNVGAAVWYKGQDRSIQGIVNELHEGSVKVVFRQPQFVAVSPTGMIHETVSISCENGFVHLSDSRIS